MFRGYVVKEWDGHCRDRFFNSELNRHLVKRCTLHYVECWRERNEQFHDPQKQRKYVIEWTEAIEEMILKSHKVDAIGWLRNNKVQIETKTTNYLQQRNKQLLTLFNKAKEEIKNRDMRSYMCVKETNM